MPDSKPWLSPDNLSPSFFGVAPDGKVGVKAPPFIGLDGTPSAWGQPLDQLQVNPTGDGLEFKTPIYWHLEHSASLSLPTITPTATYVEDLTSIENAANGVTVANSRVTLVEPGWYEFGGGAFVNGNFASLPGAIRMQLWLSKTFGGAITEVQSLDFQIAQRSGDSPTPSFATQLSGHTMGLRRFSQGEVLLLRVMLQAVSGSIPNTALTSAYFWGRQIAR